jgi:Nuclease-related domain
MDSCDQIVPPVFPPWTGGEGIQNSVKGKGMAGTESKRATVYNRPGVGVRKMEATRWLAALFFLIIMFAGIYFFNRSVRTIATLGFPVALIVFVGIIYWVKAMSDKADAYSKRAVDARRGAVAEEAVGNLLGDLPAGYFVVHDVVSKRGNIDHIVVSTKGILTIETKSHRGVVSCEGEMLKRDGKPFEKDFIKQAWSQVFSIRDLLTSQGISAPKPQPVLLFANADVQVRNQVRGVEIISRRYLPVYLKRSQNRMTAKEAEKIFEILKLSQSQMFV